MKIYLDVMGGDHAPGEIIKGAIEAINEFNVPIILVGKEEVIKEELIKNQFDDPRVSILNANSVIGFDEEPVRALRHKKDSSIVVALNHMKNEPDSVLVSAGSTGALLAGGTLILGRIKGVKRPGLGNNIPQKDKNVFLIDIGASADAQPSYLLTYAELAKIYVESVDGIENPTIGLINVGTEEEKGNQLIKEAHSLLKNSGLNFIGNVESKDILTTPADILVCDGFVGNILLKTIEGLTKFVFNGIKESLLSSWTGKIGALLIKKDLKKFKDAYDPDIVGGCPLLGVKGGIIKAHGSSKAFAIKNAIRQAIRFSENNVVEKFTMAFNRGNNE